MAAGVAAGDGEGRAGEPAGPLDHTPPRHPGQESWLGLPELALLRGRSEISQSDCTLRKDLKNAACYEDVNIRRPIIVGENSSLLLETANFGSEYAGSLNCKEQ